MPLYFCFTHSDPNYLFLIRGNKEDLEKYDYYIFPTEDIEYGKKTLFTHNDESGYCIIENVSRKEFEDRITKDFESGELIDDGKIFYIKDPLFLEYEELEGRNIPKSAEELIEFIDCYISDNDWVSGDSQWSFDWFGPENIIDQKDFFGEDE